MDQYKNNNSSLGWITMSEGARLVPYSAEYLSLLARKKKLPAKKINDIWYTTESALQEYVNRQILRNHIHGDSRVAHRLQEMPLEVAEPIKVADKAADTIVDKDTKIKHQLKSKFRHGLMSEDDHVRIAKNVKKFVETLHEKPAPEISHEIPIPAPSQKQKIDAKPTESNEAILNQISQLSSSIKILSEKVEPKNVSEQTSQQLTFDSFLDKFVKFLDLSTETHFGTLHKIWRAIKDAFKYVFKKPKLLTITLLLLGASIILPMRFVFGFFDDTVTMAYNAMKDAQTVLGFRPGTHANELLLLDKNGNVSIFGNIETEGQFRSFVKNGIAPIMVESSTQVKNLNADYLDNLSAEQFTLAFVTKNGNVTTEDVYLEGKVEVGKYLLVKGAAKLLSSLEVDGALGVFGDVELHKSLTVDGPTYLKALLSAQNINAKDIAAQNVSVENLTASKKIEGTDINAKNLLTGDTIEGRVITATDSVTAENLIAKQTLRVDGNASIQGQSVFGGFAMFNSGLQARTGDFELGVGTGGDLAVGGNATIGNSSATKDVEITSKNWYIKKTGESSFKNITVSSCSGCGSATPAGSTGAVQFNNGGLLGADTNNFFWDDTNNRLGIGTSSPYASLAVAGQIVGAYFTGTTTATSTFAGGLQATTLNINSSSASSTFSNGIILSGGCFQLADGTCAGAAGAGTITGTGIAGLPAVWTSGTNLTSSSTLSINVGGTGTSTFSNGGVVFSDGNKLTQDASNLFWDDANKRLGVGTTSPYSPLQIVSATRPQLILTDPSGGVNAKHFYASSTNAGLSLGTLYDTFAGRQEHVVIARNGRVGIGSSTPMARLALSTDGGTTIFDVGDAGVKSAFIIDANSLVGIGTTSKNLISHFSVQARGDYFAGPDRLITGVDANNQEIFNVFDNGTVGIGSTSPSQLLSVHGGALIAGTTTVNALIATSTIQLTNAGFANCNLDTDANGFLQCGTDANTPFAWTPTTWGGLLANSTSTPIQFLGGTISATSSVGTLTAGNLTATGTVSFANALTVANGGTGQTTFSSGQLLYGSNTNGIQSVATGTVSAGSTAITVTAGRSAVGGALAIDCATASGSQAGCLSTTDWNTFNSKPPFSFTPTTWGGVLANSTSTLLLLNGGFTSATSSIGTLTLGSLTATSTATSTFINLLSTNATSTAFFATTASTTNLFGANLTACDSTTGKLTWSSGLFGCGTDFNTGGSGTFSFTPTTWGSLLANSTSTPIQFLGGEISATSSVGTLTVGSISATSTRSNYFGGNVGIASTSPWGLLSVNPNGISGPAFVVGSSTATNFIVTNGGNVGVGTTTPAKLFSVAGNSYLGNGSASTLTIHSGIINYPTTATSTILAQNNAWSIATTTNAGNFPILSVDGSTGRVGLGTSTPTNLFEVAGKTAGFNTSKDGSLGSWTTNSNSLLSTDRAISTVIANGYLFAIGGAGFTNGIEVAKLNANGSVGAFATSTSALPATKCYAATATYNGYIYAIGGTNCALAVQSSVYYTKVNSDGSLGPWQTGNSLPVAIAYTGQAVIANGYIYIVGGGTNAVLGTTGQSTVYYAKLNADGSIGAWSTATNSLLGGRGQHTTVYANGYLYAISGVDTSGTATTSINYAKINADGSVNAWVNIPNALPVGRNTHGSMVANGYVYVFGGNTFTTVFNASLNADGSTGTWATTTTALPVGLYEITPVVANGYVYIAGGINSVNPQSAVYYASLARFQFAGSIDLLSLTSGALSDASGDTGGTLYAGNIYTNNKLDVSGNAQFWSDVGITGMLSIQGASTTNASPIFNVATSTGPSIFTVLSNGNIGIGTSTPNWPLQVAEIRPSIALSDLSAGTNLKHWLLSSMGGNFYVGTSTDAYGTSTPAALTILGGAGGANSSSGFVGIGTSTPGYNFEVAGHSAAFNTSRDGSLGSWTTNATNLSTTTSNVMFYAGYAIGFESSVYADGMHLWTAPVRSNGTIGSWTQSTTVLPEFRGAFATTIYNGYLYVIGGYNSVNAFTTQSTVYYARIYPDGTIGPFSITTSLPAARSFISAIVANGYIYVVNGSIGISGGQNTIYYAKANADGTVGSWSTTNSYFAKIYYTLGVANGYLYVVGGLDRQGGFTASSTLDYARLNSDGSLGSFTQNVNSLPAVRRHHSSVMANGYLYVIGGSTNGADNNTTTYFAPTNSDGSIGVFATNANAMPAAKSLHSSFVVNGNIFAIGGSDPNGTSVQLTIVSASTARVQIAGNLDLLSLTTQSLNDSPGSVGGTLYAGNIFSNNKLEIVGNTQLWNGLSVNGPVSFVAGTSTLPSPFFNIATSTGPSIFSVLSNGNIGIGTSTPNWPLQVAEIRPSIALSDLSAGTNLKHWLLSSMGGNFYVGTSTDAYGTSTPAALTILGGAGGANSSSGFMGIGTSSPSKLFSVAGNSYLGNGSASTLTIHSGIINYPTTATSTILAQNNAWSIATTTNAGNFPILSVDGSTGRVGLGTSTPTNLFEVAGKTAGFNTSQDGSLGAWTTNANPLLGSFSAHSSVVANGYVYVIGGRRASDDTYLSTVYYAKLNSDGSTGTWNTNANPLPIGLAGHTSVVANGYIYVLGGNTCTCSGFGLRSNKVYYAKLNKDGSTGTWTTNANSLQFVLQNHTSVVANGYIYVIAGNPVFLANSATTYYAKLNADGSTGLWIPTSNDLPAALSGHTSVVANGYVYVIGGNASTTYYAHLNADGSTGAWTKSSSLFSADWSFQSSVVANGYLYAIGGNNGSGYQSTVYFAKLNNDGSIGPWATNPNSLPQGINDHTSVIANGYVYAMGGYNGADQSTVYYASTARLKLAGALDLLGLTSGGLTEPDDGSGSSIYAGNIYSNANLEVVGNAQFWNGVGINGPLSIQGSTSSPLFTVATTTATSTPYGSIFTVLYSGNVGIGTTTPGTLLSIGATSTAYINLSNTSTSTFSNGINVNSGCFAISGACVGVVSSVSNSDGTLTISPTAGAVVASLNLGHANTFTASSTFPNINVGWITATSSATSTFARLFATNGTFTYASSTQLTVSNQTLLATTGGSVGIGTTSPYAKLTVWGQNTSPSLSNKLFDVVQNASSSIFTVYESGVVDIGGKSSTSPAHRLSLFTGGQQNLTFLNTGALILGGSPASTSRQSILAVQGSADIKGALALGSKNSYLSYLAGDGTAASTLKIASATNGGPTLAVSDFFGWSMASIGDLNGDGVVDLAVGAPQDTGGTNRGAVYILFMNANGTVASSVKIASGTNGGPTLAANDAFGTGIASIGDLNGDGISDIAVGAYGDSSNRGSVYILFMKANGTAASTVRIASATNGGPTLALSDFFGRSVASMGDLNGDGVTDLAVGAYGDDTGASGAGAVYILFMNSNGTAASTVQIASATNGGPTLSLNDLFGSSVAPIDDLNGDGIPDLAVGAVGDATGGAGRGATYILFMNSNGKVTSSVKIASGTNGGPTLLDSGQFGSAITSAGDVNGDGIPDLVVGADGDSTGGTNRGAVYTLFMNPSGTVASSVKIASGTNGGPTLADADKFGSGVASMGDLNGDGIADIAVGAYGDTTGTGAAYILTMTNTSRLRLATANNERLTINSSGNVGIASTSPWGLLSINPNGISGPAFVVGSSTATKFIVMNGGNVGLATTSPGTLLSLGDTTAYINLSNNSTSTFSNGINTNSGCFAISGTCIVSGSAFPFTPTTWGGLLANGTNTPLQLFGGEISATSSIGTLTVGSISATSTRSNYFGGNVGVGTTSPAKLFSVAGNSYLGSGTGSTLTIHSDTINYPISSTSTIPSAINAWSLATSNTATPILSIDSASGKVGIGTAATSNTLRVANSDSTAYGGLILAQLGILNTDTTTNNTSGIAFQTYDSASAVIGGALVSAVFSDHTAGSVDADLVFQTSENGSRTEKLRILNNGKVGIGTTTPGSLLSVHGGALIAGTTTVNALIATSTIQLTNAGFANCNLDTDANGFIQCGTDADTPFAWTPTTWGGVLANSTSTLLLLNGGFTSATSSIGTLTLGSLTATSTATSTFTNLLATNATSTAFFATTASTTNLFGANLTACDSTTGKLTWASGLFGCGTDFNSGGSGSFPFTPTTWGGLLANSTSTPIQFLGGTISATSSVGTLTVGVLTATSTATSTFRNLLATNATSTAFFATTASTTNLFGANLTACDSTTGKLTWASGVFGCGTDFNTGGSGTFSFTPTTWGGVLANSTSTLLLLNGGFTSATSSIGTLTLGSLTATSTATSTFTNLLSTNATSTAFFATTASTTNFFGANLNTCQSGNVLTYSGGLFGCAADQTGASASFSFTPTTNFAQLANSTSTQLWLRGSPISLSASSTSIFDYASTTQLTVSNQTLLATTGGSVGVASTSPWGLLSVNPNGISGPAFVVGSSTATKFIVTNGGNVGVGTTSPSATFSIQGASSNVITQSAPLALLVIGGVGGDSKETPIAQAAGAGGGITLVGGTGGTGNVQSGGLGGNISFLGGDGGPAGTVNGGNGGNIYLNGGNGGSGGTNNGTVGNIILANIQGLVGIGTTTPGSLLSVHGGALIAGTTTVNALIATSTIQLTNAGFANCNLDTDANGFLQCGTDANTFEFTPTTWGGLLANSTSTPIQFLGGEISATSSIGTLTFGVLTATSTATSTFRNLLSTNATSTAFFATTASTTNFFGSNLNTCNSGNVLTYSGGLFGCAADATSAGGYPFTPTTWGGVLVSGTTSPLQLFGGEISATSSIGTLTFGVLTATSTATSTFRNLLSTNATSTAFFATTASTTNFFGANLNTCNSGNVLTYSGGLFGCAADANTFEFAPTTWGGLLANSTSTLIQFLGGEISATSSIGTLTFGVLTATSTATSTFRNLLATNATSTAFFATTASTTNFFGANLNTCNSGNVLTYSGGLFGCAADSTGSGSFPFTPTTWGGLLANSTSTPIQFLGGTISATSSVGTLTAGNLTATGTVSFTNALTVANGGTGQTTFSSGQLLYGSNTNGLQSVATGTISAGSTAITVTAGRAAVGGALAIDCATASGSQAGCLSSTDWNTFNNKPPFSFTPTTWGGLLANSTSTPVQFLGGEISATSSVGTLTVGSISATSTISNYFGGKIGIGTTSPSQLLSVHGNTLISGDITSVANITATGTLTLSGLVGGNVPGGMCSGLGTNSSGAVGCKSVFIIKRAAESVTSSVTLQNDDDFKFTVSAGDLWIVRMNINGLHSTPDIQTAFTGANTCDYAFFDVANPETALATVCTATVSLLARTTAEGYMLTGAFGITSNGTFQFQWAPNTNTATALTINASSTLEAFKVSGSDYAEAYATLDPTLLPGDIVSLDPEAAGSVIRSSGNRQNIIGVISTKPGMVIGGEDIGDTFHAESRIPVNVALTGRVPVRVTLEGGPIIPGDRIALSSIPGFGRKATAGEPSIGIALNSFVGNSTTTFNAQTISEDRGSVLLFLDKEQTDFANVFDEIESTYASAPLTMESLFATTSEPSSIASSSTPAMRIATSFGRAILALFKSIGIEIAQGFLKVKDLVAETLFVDKATIADLDADKLQVNSTATFGSTNKPIGITIYDRISGEPQCIYSESGILKTAAGECSADALSSVSPSTGSASALELPISPVGEPASPPASEPTTSPPAEPVAPTDSTNTSASSTVIDNATTPTPTDTPTTSAPQIPTSDIASSTLPAQI